MVFPHPGFGSPSFRINFTVFENFFEAVIFIFQSCGTERGHDSALPLVRTGTHDVCLTRLSRNWAKIGEFYIDLREGTGRKRAAVAHPNTGSWRVRRTQAGFFGGPLELRFRDRELWREGGRRRVWSKASLLKPRI